MSTENPEKRMQKLDILNLEFAVTAKLNGNNCEKCIIQSEYMLIKLPFELTIMFLNATYSKVHLLKEENTLLASDGS